MTKNKVSKPDLSKEKGYDPHFLGDLKVELPQTSTELEKNLTPLKKDKNDFELKYANYSLAMHAERKFALYTASNINGKLFREVTRKEVWPGGDRWYKDSRISSKSQWGSTFYRSKMSDFDRGHLVKREDVQWGKTEEDAVIGARNTFFYTNAAPQHARLNQGIWLELENYVLHSEARPHDLRISVFTGPVFTDTDPYFVTEVKGNLIQLPTLFWKIVYYIDQNEELKRVAFMIGQEKLLIRDKIVVAPTTKDFDLTKPKDELFTDFEDAETYQVNISTIEKLTKLKFPDAVEPFKDDRTLKQILRKVQTKKLNISDSGGLNYEVLGISL
jgi:endonuclease G